MEYIDGIENDTNMLSLRKICVRKMININKSKIDYWKLADQIIKHLHADMDLCYTILDCCCEHTTYLKHFGFLTKVKIYFRYHNLLHQILVIFKGYF